jgi:saccharopine dehydrogenase-like NADP-dependent oxidoreductase
VVGLGAVGARATRQLLSTGSLDDLTLIDVDGARADAAVASFGAPARVASELPGDLRRGDVVVLALPSGHRTLAERAVEQGADVVSTSDDCGEVRALLALDEEARVRGCHVVVGAAFSPGMTCVLAMHAAAGFERVDEIHVARVGTGGPACARQRHQALAGRAVDWRDGAWNERPGGSGRELCWFPDPVRALDCYRAATPEAMLLVEAFPGVRRVTARTAANRRDRLTAHLPMLRPPHPEGHLGAVRVEVRGWRGVARSERVLGAVDRPAVAAGAVAGLAARWALDGRLSRPGAAGLGVLAEPGAFLAGLAERGVKAAVFEGSMMDGVAG